MTNAAPYLVAESIRCQYGREVVLRDFSLQVDQGEFIAVVGPNGSGKSTLLRAIAGSMPLAAGRVLFEGRDLFRLKHRERARLVAVVPQETKIDFDFTVAEVVQMGRLPYLGRFRGQTDTDRAVVHAAMRVADVAALAERSVTGLSGGERQRVVLARALAQEPQLLLLDEPTAHLDIAHQVDLLDLARQLNLERGMTIVAVLHDLNLAAQYSARIVMVHDGRVVADGTPAEVITEERIAEVYGSRVRVLPHPVEGTPHVLLLSSSGR